MRGSGEWKVVFDSPLNNIHSGVVILAGSGMLKITQLFSLDSRRYIP